MPEAVLLLPTFATRRSASKLALAPSRPVHQCQHSHIPTLINNCQHLHHHRGSRTPKSSSISVVNVGTSLSCKEQKPFKNRTRHPRKILPRGLRGACPAGQEVTKILLPKQYRCRLRPARNPPDRRLPPRHRTLLHWPPIWVTEAQISRTHLLLSSVMRLQTWSTKQAGQVPVYGVFLL